MKVAVAGLWHLGCVTAAALSEFGIETVALDDDGAVIDNLRKGIAPVEEKNLASLIKKNYGVTLSFEKTSDSGAKAALQNADYTWICYDTPVDENDNADVDFVINKIKELSVHIKRGAGIIISSQIPAGSTRNLIRYFRENRRDIKCAVSPENLRLGNAVEIFMNPDRIVIGTEENDREYFEPLFLKISGRLEWMRVESAEMAKHAINGFLAVSVTFANEIASLCEKTGADAGEVARALKTESRIGPKAYLSPGGAIAGGTLNRDINFLRELSQAKHVNNYLTSAVKASNEAHKNWNFNKAAEVLDGVRGKNIGVLGLTYKPGTNTLRRSSSVELCRALVSAGAEVRAFDPAVGTFPDELASVRNMSFDALFENADCVIVCTGWDEFKSSLKTENINSMRNKNIIDAFGFLDKEAAIIASSRITAGGLKYRVLGRGSVSEAL